MQFAFAMSIVIGLLGRIGLLLPRDGRVARAHKIMQDQVFKCDDSKRLTTTSRPHAGTVLGGHWKGLGVP